MAYLLGDIISKLKWTYTTSARANGCTLANISARVGRDSEIKLHEIYKFHRHAEEQSWSDDVQVLSMLLNEVMPDWDRVERMLFRYIGCKPWHNLHWFLTKKEDVKMVCELLNKDIRPTTNKRYITVYTSESQMLKEEVDKLLYTERCLKMRFALKLYQVENMPYLSTKLKFGEVLLQVTEKGFVPDVGEGDIAAASELILNSKTKTAALTREVKNVAVSGESPLTSTDADSFIRDYEGQLGGVYRFQCTRDDAIGEDGEHRWHVRLTVQQPAPTDLRNIEVIDQRGRIVIRTHSDNLPWLGYWPDNCQPLEKQVDNLLFSESSMCEHS